MRKGNACQEAKPQAIETKSAVLIDSVALGKKDCLRILHVDDDVCLLEVSKQILSTENNFEVDGALSVDEAFKKMEKGAYDAVVSDYEMPMKNGLQFLKELREKKNDIPFILFTGKGREEVAIQALNWGADSYINKNGPPEIVYAELAHAIVSSVEKAKAKRQMFYDAKLFQNVTDPIMATDDKRIIKVWNKAAENLFGWTASEVTERSVQEVFDSVQIEPPFKVILKELDSCGIFHGEIIRKNKAGVPLAIELSIISLKDRFGRFIGNVAVYHDISQRKKTEEVIRLSEEKYRSLFENASDVILTGDLSGKITTTNEAIKKYGFQKEQVVGRNVREFLSIKDGVRQDKIFQEVSSGKSVSGELEAPVIIGNRTLEVKTDPLRIGDRVVGFQTILRDVTERKKAEDALNRMMDELVMVNEKLNVVGGLTRHDIRNKLSVISGNIFLLKKKQADCADITERLNAMEQACQSIVKILDFSRMYEELGANELYFIDVEKTVDEAVVLFSTSPNVKVINECHGLTVLADSFLRQLFYNLIDNSIKHGKRVTKIRVHYEKADEDNLNLIYEDDGVGVSTDNKAKLFKEGFSTSGSTGYGLNLIRKTMEVYGWAIQENGEPDKGAKFTITIPKINQKGKENFQIAKQDEPGARQVSQFVEQVGKSPTETDRLNFNFV